MSEAIVTAVRVKYPTPLGSTHPAFLLEVAAALRKGLLKKNTGTFITLPDGTNVSQDVVMDTTGNAWDILQDGEGVARPTWNVSPHIDDLSRYYDVESSPVPPVNPPGGNPPADLAPIYARLDALESQQDADGATLSRHTAQIDTLQAQVAALVVSVQAIKVPTYTEGTIGLQAVLRGQTVKWGLK